MDWGSPQSNRFALKEATCPTQRLTGSTYIARVSWATYAHEAMGLLSHLGVQRAFVLRGCRGCSTATAFGVTYPEATLGLVLHWPVGGVHWRLNGLERFESHVNFVREHDLTAVVNLAWEEKSFWAEPAAGPWASGADAAHATLAARYLQECLEDSVYHDVPA